MRIKGEASRETERVRGEEERQKASKAADSEMGLVHGGG
jgi:hypothetical protein